MSKYLALVVFLVACGGTGDDPVCGDGFVDSNEQCDDGNVVGGDGCTATCTREPRCGDGAVDGTEECDDGNTTAGDGCSATCTLECGNGVMDTGEECDDGNITSFDGCSSACTTEAQYAISATWQIRSYDMGAQACPVGFDTAAVVSQPLDGNDNEVGTPIIDLFTCADNAGTTAPLYEGRYRVYIDITDTNGSTSYATSTSAIVDLTGDKSFGANIYTDAGYFAWAWDLVGASSNSSLTCAQVSGIDGVEIASTLSSSQMALSDVFSCEDGSGLTAALPEGTYTVSAAALDMNGLSLGTAPALTNKDIVAPNKVTDLGTVTIPIDGL